MKLLQKWNCLIILIIIIKVLSSVTSESVERIYTFDQYNSYLQIDSTELWPITYTRKLSFSFKTDRSNVLLLFHTVDFAPVGYPIYEFYLMLEKSQLNVIHEFGQAKDTFLIGKGLHQNQWHSVELLIDPSSAIINLTLDKGPVNSLILSSFKLIYSHTTFPYHDNYFSLLYFGGVNSERTFSHRLYDPPRFMGCIGNITFNHFKLDKIEKVKIENFGLSKGCVNKCNFMNNCYNDVECVNHYTHVTCDCSGTVYENSRCSSTELTTITFRGYSLIRFKAFDWNDRVFSSSNKVSLNFKTLYDNSFFICGFGIYPSLNYFLIYIENGYLFLKLDLGDGPIIASIQNSKMTDNNWHNITFVHNERNIKLFLDNLETELNISGPNYYFHLEPYLYVGGIADTLKRINQFEFSKNKFVGCMQSVYFNGQNILLKLKENNLNVEYQSLFDPDFKCSSVFLLPITFQTLKSYIKLTKKKKSLDLYFEFKTSEKDAVLASGYLNFGFSRRSLWILYFENEEINFIIIESNTFILEETEGFSSLEPIKIVKDEWQKIKIESQQSKIVITLNNENTLVYNYSFNLNFENDIILGGLKSSFIRSAKIKTSLIGCIQNITVDQSLIDPREIFRKKFNYNGKISLDNCSLIKPCDIPGVCENGGVCKNINGQAECDCGNTGYIGKTCHFSIYKKSCEEYYLVGYRENGTYMIDIDRNGLFSPARVECTMSAQRIETSIKNNLPLEYSIRKQGWEGYYMDIDYRDFNKTVLKTFISRNKRCTQEIKYGCRKAPLRFFEDTWMISASDKRVININGNLHNCDNNDDIEDEDIGIINDVNFIGITRVYVRKNENLTEISEGRLTISPIRCIDLNIQEQIVTFKTQSSYLEVKGWEKNDLTFSFRTFSSRGVLAYQAPFHPHHGYFKISIINSNELLFEYLVNGNQIGTKLTSRMSLNTGEWQQVWVDYENRHMRFTVNVDYVMIDLDIDSNFDQFEGPLYIGGAPKNLLKNEENGFIGCFKNLRIHNEIIPFSIPKFVTDIKAGCVKSCSVNPCEKEANCIEMWGSYECQCRNPYTQKGKNCEHDFNSNSITFKNKNASLYTVIQGKDSNTILKKNILISFRTYESSGLIFYAKDENNNFLQLHFEDNYKVFLTFNTLTKVIRGMVQILTLNKGSLIQVKIERQASRTIFNVFTNCETLCKKFYTIIEYPLKLLTHSYTLSWTLGEKFEMIKTNPKFFQNSPHVQLFIAGGNETYATSFISPFIGCISGLVIEDQLFDLEKLAKQKLESINDTQTIQVKCNMKCDSIPCANDGECKEALTTGKITCNCNDTSYKGENCNLDTGIKFDGSSIIKYNLADVTLPSNDSDFVRIKFAFSASLKNDSNDEKIKRLMFSINQYPKRTLIALFPKGALWIQDFNGKGYGFLRFTPGYPSKLTDGYRHWVIYTRKGNKATLEIDHLKYSIEPKFVTEPNLTKDESKYFIKVGGDLDSEYQGYHNYVGCISNIEIQLNNVHINPLEAALNGDDKAQVLINGSLIFADIKQQRCADFRPKISKFKINLPLEVSHEKWAPMPPIKILFNFPARNMDTFKAKFIRQLYPFLLCTSFLSIIMIVVAIYMFKLNKKYKLNKFRVETPFFNSKRTTKIPYVKVPRTNENLSLNHSIKPARSIHFKPEKTLKFSQLQALEEVSEKMELDEIETISKNIVSNGTCVNNQT